jgi:Fe-S cluster biogenesis protein NfuA
MNNLVEEKIIKILNKIRPYLNSEGGDLQYIGFEDGIVYVRMLGACVDCVGLDSTLKDGIEALLVENIPEVIEVRNCGIEEEIDVIGDYE